MTSEPDDRDRLPFEPTKKRQKSPKTKPTSAAETGNNSEKTPAAKNPKAAETVKNSEKTPAAKNPKQSQQVKKLTKEEMAIPQVVSVRMGRRMAVLCGIPTFLGVATFFVSYIIVSHGWFKLPHIAVLLTSMGFFGLGVIGLSYGVLSASWDEEVAGSMVGWQEFKVNWGRMVSAWRETRQKNV